MTQNRFGMISTEHHHTHKDDVCMFRVVAEVQKFGHILLSVIKTAARSEQDCHVSDPNLNLKCLAAS